MLERMAGADERKSRIGAEGCGGRLETLVLQRRAGVDQWMSCNTAEGDSGGLVLERESGD